MAETLGPFWTLRSPLPCSAFGDDAGREESVGRPTTVIVFGGDDVVGSDSLCVAACAALAPDGLRSSDGSSATVDTTEQTQSPSSSGHRPTRSKTRRPAASRDGFSGPLLGAGTALGPPAGVAAARSSMGSGAESLRSRCSVGSSLRRLAATGPNGSPLCRAPLVIAIGAMTLPPPRCSSADTKSDSWG